MRINAKYEQISFSISKLFKVKIWRYHLTDLNCMDSLLFTIASVCLSEILYDEKAILYLQIRRMQVQIFKSLCPIAVMLLEVYIN